MIAQTLRILVLLSLAAVAASQPLTADRRTTDDLTAQIRDELAVKERPWQFGLAPMINSSSDDARTGYGGSIFFEYDKLKPYTFQAVLGVYWSKFERIFPGQKILSLNFDLDALYRPTIGRLQPYAGGGVGVISNSWPTGEPDSSYSLGGYDERTPTENLDFGTSLAVHLRTGAMFRLSRDLSLFADCRLTTTGVDMTVIRTVFPSMQSYDETVHYNVGAVALKLGIVIRVRN